MSRHRNVRSLNYEEEYYDDDDVYGHSVEDNYCISPGTAAQFTFNRDRHVDLANYMGEEEGIPEEDEEDDNDVASPSQPHCNSMEYTRPHLNDIDNAKLNSCLEEVRNVLGEAVPEHILIDTIMKHNYSLDTSLNELLNQQAAPKPQREKRENRRNRAEEFDYDSDYALMAAIDPEGSVPESLHDNVMSFVLPQGGSMKFGPDALLKSPAAPSENIKSKHSELLNSLDNDASSSNTQTLKTSNFQLNQINTVNLPDSINHSKSLYQKDKNPECVCTLPKVLRELKGQENIHTEYSGLICSNISTSLIDEVQTQDINRSRGQTGHGTLEKSNVKTLVASKMGVNKKLPLAKITKAEDKDTSSFTCLSNLAKLDNNIRTEWKKTTGQSGTLGGLGLPSNENGSHPSLSGLAKVCDVNAPVLSGVKQVSGGNKLSQSKAGIVSLQDLATNHNNNSKQSNMEESERHGMNKEKPSLADLAQAHNKSAQGQTLAVLAKSNAQPNQENKSSNMVRKSNSSHGGPSLADLAKSDCATIKQPFTSLSDLAKAHGVLKSGTGLDRSKYTDSTAGSSQFKTPTSLEAHGKVCKNAQVGMDSTASVEVHKQSSLRLVAKPKSSEVVQKKENNVPNLLTSLAVHYQKGKIAQVGMDSPASDIEVHQQLSIRLVAKPKSSELAQKKENNVPNLSTSLAIHHQKGKDTQAVMDSLTSHLKQSSEIVVHQQSAFKRKDAQVVMDSPAGRKEVHQQSSFRHDKTKPPPESVIEVHQQLSYGHENNVPNITLADLAKPVKEFLGKVSNLTLPDLKKVDKTLKCDGTKLQNISTKGETCDTPENMKVGYESAEPDSGNVFIDDIISCMDDAFSQNVDQHITGPSILGKVLCLRIKIKGIQGLNEKGYKLKHFRYKNQVKSTTSMSKVVKKAIIPFDFGTPSPDDIVKSRQKLAFTRSGNRN